MDKPILFSPPMVRALLEGRKTQTRRLLKPYPLPMSYPSDMQEDMELRGYEFREAGDGCQYAMLSKYQPGDRLWVRESFVDLTEYLDFPLFQGRQCPIFYKADDEFIGCHRYKPSIHMPRWASRLTLIVAGVKVERLQDISEVDAAAEGADPEHLAHLFYDAPGAFAFAMTGPGVPARLTFELLWNSIHGPDAWEANPWVVALIFRVIQANIDRIEA